MEFNEYYRKELSSLRFEGAEFSRENPGLSTFLSKEGQDPDVERLLEGFAFLTGRLRQQLDKELPEVSHTLVQLLWPNYVRPVPSYCIIQYDELKEGVENQIVEKGTQILSKSIAEGLQCKFQTSYETQIMPLKLKDAEYFVHGKKSSIELNLQMSATGNLNDLTFNTIRVFLGGSKFIAKDLYMYMIKFVESIEISVIDNNDGVMESFNIDTNSVCPIGFMREENLAPYPLTVFNGYTLLQEYFCYNDKFLFLDINNLNSIMKIDESVLKQSREFKITFNFSKRFEHSEVPTIENFHLYCTPVINIFQTDAVPIRKDEARDEYLVVAADIPKEHCEVFSIQKVRGWITNKNAYKDYALFESFEHDPEAQYYSSRVKLSTQGDKIHTYLRFASDEGLFEDNVLSNATVSVDIQCTNKNTPNKELLLGDICIPDPLSKSAHLKFRNITIPTLSYLPPLDGDFLWKIISNMSLNYLSLDNIQALRIILETYDFIGANDVQQKEKTAVILKGLQSLSHKKIEMMDKGMPIRGIETHLKVDPTKFSCLGEAYLFCSVLNEFFTLYGNINSFNKLVVNIENEDIFNWKPRMGSREFL